jgi:RimJ/RimL family protein N-acetyltransferase
MPSSILPAIEVPILETERLRLRGHRLDDFAASFAMWSDPQVTQYIANKPLTEEEAWVKLLRYVGHWSMMGYGYWVAEEKTTGNFVGEVGFSDYKREIEPSLKGIPEIGWSLATQAHGKGFATEAARAAIAWGDVHFQSAKTACIVAPGNLPSIRVAVKCGYREFQHTTYRGKPMTMFFRELRAAE